MKHAVMMRHAMMTLAVVLAALAAAPDAALADVRTRERTQLEFEGMLGRMMGMFGGSAARDGVVTTTVVSGDRMMTRDDDDERTIVDLAERRSYRVDDDDQVYEVTSFEEIRRRMEEMRERAREQAPPDAGGQPPAGDGQAPEYEVDVDVQRPGDTRTINGFDTALTVTTITVRQKGRTLEEAGGIVMTARSWVTAQDIGTKEILDFQRRYAQAMGEVLGVDASAESMASAMGMFPGLGEAMKRFQEEGMSMAGAAVLTETTFESVRGAAQTSQTQDEPEEPRRGRFGLGGLGSRIGRALGGGDDAAGEPRSTIFTSTTELLEVDASPDPAAVTIPANYRQR